MPVSTSILSLFVLGLACGPAPAGIASAALEPQPAATDFSASRASGVPERVIAIGDLHADLPSTMATLRMAGLVDAQGAWSGGRTVLVQTGDTTDRGPDSKAVLELLIRLSSEAEASGGRVLALLGNHEVMNLQGDWRYVHPGDVQQFGSVPLRRAAFAAGSSLGAWLRGLAVVGRVGDTVYAHGGVTAALAAVGLTGINRRAREAIDADPDAAVLGEEGPLWFRGYLVADESLACEELEAALLHLGARRMVVGHTTQRSGRIAVRCEGALLGIDTGISRHYGGNRSALELRNGDARAIYPEGTQDLPDPPTTARLTPQC
ncbi:MAG: metallophosphoesterase [Myxococcota bacterium]|nr:metallophosphoesterase [Myxococcota bacterium]